MKRIIKILSPVLTLCCIIGIILFFHCIAFFLFPNDPNRSGESVKLILSVIAGYCLLYGLYISNRRAKATEESVKIQGTQINLSLKSQIDERFKNAIEHLGTKNEPIILGGIVELHQIAKDNPEDYTEVVFNILCSYIRTETNIYKKKGNEINSQVITTIINYLFKEYPNNPYATLKADLSFSNLYGQKIINCNLQEANLSFCNLGWIENTNLSNADLGVARIIKPFKNNQINNVKFYNTNIYLVDFENIEFRNTLDELFSPYCIHCRFENVKFDDLTFMKAEFIGCIFLNCTFNNASIVESNFYACGFEDINFSNCQYIYNSNFSGSVFYNVSWLPRVRGLILKGCNVERPNKRFISIEDHLNSQRNKSLDKALLNLSEYCLGTCSFDDLTSDDCGKIIDKYNELTKPLDFKD